MAAYEDRRERLSAMQGQLCVLLEEVAEVEKKAEVLKKNAMELYESNDRELDY